MSTDKTLVQLARDRGLLSADRASTPSDAPTLVRTGAVEATALTKAVREESERKLKCPVCSGGLARRATALICERCGVKLSVDLALAGDEGLGLEVPGEVREASKDPANQLGEFVLVRKVGEGGYGAVYKAWQRKLSRFVAIKLLHESDDETTLARFSREAQFAGRLAHPNIVPIHEVGRQDGKPYISMDFIDGAGLNETRLEPRRAAEVMIQVAEAVQCAHEKGIVHRDLKPHNVMLGRDGRVWVMDFGLARQIQKGSTLTAPETVLGTPAYMAPEQAMGSTVDTRADIYALGATLYQVLTGTAPFEGDSPISILRQVTMDEPAPPRKRLPSIPADLETIVLKAMEKDPSRRYESAKAFAEDLRRYLDGRPILAVPAGLATRAWKFARRHRTFSVAGILVVAGLTIAVAVVLSARMKRQRTIRTVRAEARLAEDQGNFELAHHKYEQLLAIDPSNEEFKSAHAASEEKAKAFLRLRQAESYLEQARTERRKWTQAEEQIEKLRRDVAEKSKELEPLSPLDQRRRVWHAERQLERAVLEAAEHRAAMMKSLISAIELDPHQKSVKELLAELYYAEFREARERGDHFHMERAFRMAKHYDSGSREAELVAEGQISISSDPGGAEVLVYKLEELLDPRLAEIPFNPPVLGITPLAAARIPIGRYMLIVRKEGFRDVRLPLLVVHGLRLEHSIRLLREEEIGGDFVYVPPGPFIFGGDSRAFLTSPREADTSLPGYLIGRHEVTFAEYRDFLAALLKEQGAKAAFARLPRDEDGGKTYIGIAEEQGIVGIAPGIEPRWPVFGVSATDAEAYCEWKTRVTGIRHRLPSAREWEKAARGTDGRWFPWGDRFDWTFAKGALSRAGPLLAEPVGTFEGDVSPYGVRDLAGGVHEWTADWWMSARNLRFVCGGSWLSAEVNSFRSAARISWETSHVDQSLGFRVVKELPKK